MNPAVCRPIMGCCRFPGMQLLLTPTYIGVSRMSAAVMIACSVSTDMRCRSAGVSTTVKKWARRKAARGTNGHARGATGHARGANGHARGPTGQRPVLVCGGAGFIGAHLCARLLTQIEQVICIDNFCTSTEDSLENLLGHPGFTL